MSVYISWIFAYLMLIKGLYTFEIPLPNINVSDSSILLSLPGDKFEAVFFYIEMNMRCAGEFAQATRSSGSSLWTVKHYSKTKVTQNVPFRISTLVELSDDSNNSKKILTRVSSYKIDNKGQLQNVQKTAMEKCYKETLLRGRCNRVETEYANGEKPMKANELMFDATFRNEYNLMKDWSHEARSLVELESKEYVAFTISKEHTYINDNKLHLKAKKNTQFLYGIDGCTSLEKNEEKKRIECQQEKRGPLRTIIPPVISSKIHTRGRFAFKYGRIEYRAKMANGDWLFPYILLQPHDTYAEDLFTSQIRLGYARGNEHLFTINNTISLNTKALFGSVLNWNEQKPKEVYSSYISQSSFASEFHDYTVIWHKDRIIYKVDGYTYGIIRDPDVLRQLQKPCFIVLGLTVNGIANFPNKDIPKSYKDFSNSEPKAYKSLYENLSWNETSLAVEYIRVYTTHKKEK